MEPNVFTVRDLVFSYEKNRVLDGLSFSLSRGKVTTLIGANGCGKSTLFRIMTKNLKPQQGEILVNGQALSEIRLRDFARQAAIVHQHNTAPVDITVEKLVSYGRTPYQSFGFSKNPEEDRAKVRWAMEVTNTLRHKDRPVSALSGGQRQRVWIATALAQGTKVLFLDEPTTYLDVRYQLQILQLIRRLNEEYGMTILMVLHDINQSLCYSDEIAAMKDGRIFAQGAPEEIITPEMVRMVFGVELRVELSCGKPFVLPI